MKNLLLSLFIFLTSISFSQQMTYVDLGLEYNISYNQAWSEDSIYIDTDNNPDILIGNYFEYNPNYTTLLIRIIIKGYDNNNLNNFINVVDNDVFNGIPDNILIKDCHNGTSQTSQTAYVYEDSYSNYTFGYFKVPFQFNTINGNHCGFLFIRYNGNIITVEGYSWNEITVNSNGGVCSCDGNYLSIDELVEEGVEVDKYFNLLGQEIKDPHGFVIVLYKNGITKKMYIE